MKEFVYTAWPSRVVFGAGALEYDGVPRLLRAVYEGRRPEP